MICHWDGRGWRMLRVGRNVSLHPLKLSSDWWIAAEPRPLNQTRDPSLHKTLGKTRCVFISPRLWHASSSEGSAIVPKATLLEHHCCTDLNNLLDHTIMGKEDKHTPPCCKARLPSRPQGYRAPAELLNATKLIYISAQQLRFTNAHTQP